MNRGAKKSVEEMQKEAKGEELDVRRRNKIKTERGEVKVSLRAASTRYAFVDREYNNSLTRGPSDSQSSDLKGGPVKITKPISHLVLQFWKISLC